MCEAEAVKASAVAGAATHNASGWQVHQRDEAKAFQGSFLFRGLLNRIL